MKNYILDFNKQQVEKINKSRDFKIPSFKAGDSVTVKYKITEGTNTRIQAFTGVVIARSKDLTNYCATFTVRKMSSGIGVERKFALYSPFISEIKVEKQGIVRRSKLYYLRSLTGKASRIKEKLDFLEKDKTSVATAKKAEKAEVKKEAEAKEQVEKKEEDVKA